MASMPIIRTLLVDDHAVVRGGLRYFLSNTGDIDVVGEAADGREALAMVDELNPDVVVMDLMMPGMDGIDTTEHLHHLHPKVRVLALSSFVDGARVLRAIQVGAAGYIVKDVAGAELAGAIRAVYAKRPMLGPDATQALINAVGEPPKPGADLSDREREVLTLMVTGRSNMQIAILLTISRNTVRHHVQNILGKLGAINRTEAVGMAVQYGLTPAPPVAEEG
jgi:two-component system, NarL family, response regulator LiaR